MPAKAAAKVVPIDHARRLKGLREAYNALTDEARAEFAEGHYGAAEGIMGQAKIKFEEYQDAREAAGLLRLA